MEKSARIQRGTDNRKWGTLIVLLLVYFAPNYIHYQLSPISGDIMQIYSMTPAMFSKVFTAPMIPAVFLSVISGILTDRYGAKPVLGISLIFTLAGSILRLFSGTYLTLFLSMILIGVSGGAVNANGVKVLSGNIPREKISFFTGLALASSTIALTIATGTTSFFSSFRSVNIVSVVLSVAVLILWFAIADNTAPNYSSTAGVPVRTSLKEVSRSHTVWLASATLFFIMASLLGIGSYLPMVLAGRGMSPVAAGTYTAVFTAGNLVGSFASPAIDQVWKRTKIQIMILILLIGLGTAVAWCTPAGLPLFAVLLVTGASIGGILPITMSLPIRSGEVSPDNAGLAGGIISTLQLAGAILLPSYIIAPIAGENLKQFFLMTGCLMVVPLAINLILYFRKRNEEIK